MINLRQAISAGAMIGLNSILIKPIRGLKNIIGSDGTVFQNIVAHATIEEHHHDEMEITDHPVEVGASVTDHAFKRPAEITLHLAWSNSPSSIPGAISVAKSVLAGNGPDQVKAIYQQLLKMQASRALFILFTGKRVYTNMLCKSLTTETDFKTENILMITMQCKQLILVNSQTVNLSKDTQANPKTTGSVTDKGAASLTSSGKVVSP